MDGGEFWTGVVVFGILWVLATAAFIVGVYLAGPLDEQDW